MWVGRAGRVGLVQGNACGYFQERFAWSHPAGTPSFFPLPVFLRCLGTKCFCFLSHQPKLRKLNYNTGARGQSPPNVPILLRRLFAPGPGVCPGGPTAWLSWGWTAPPRRLCLCRTWPCAGWCQIQTRAPPWSASAARLSGCPPGNRPAGLDSLLPSYPVHCVKAVCLAVCHSWLNISSANKIFWVA